MWRATQASSEPTTMAGNTAYAWSMRRFNLDAEVSNPDDYWSFNGCALNSSWYKSQFEAKEVGSPLDTLVTFDSDGEGCVLDRIKQLGESWFTAAQACVSPGSPVVTLKCVSPICFSGSCPPNPCRVPICIGAS